MAVNYAYNYAEIEYETGMCIGIVNTTDPNMDGYDTGEGSYYMSVPVRDEEYLFKYYINGNWYEDPEGTIPWTSSLL